MRGSYPASLLGSRSWSRLTLPASICRRPDSELPHTETHMTSFVRFDSEDSVGVITIDSPPVNALSPAVIAGLQDAVSRFESDRSLRALVVCCEGRTFV